MITACFNLSFVEALIAIIDFLILSDSNSLDGVNLQVLFYTHTLWKAYGL